MAKLVVLLVGLTMFAAVAALVWYLANRFERAETRQVVPASRWRPGEWERADGVHIVVERVASNATGEGDAGGGDVLETREVGVVAAGADDAADRLADLRELAADRARMFNDQARRR